MLHLIQAYGVCRMASSNGTSWIQEDRRRVLFFNMRAQNMEHCFQYYEQHLGMQLHRRLGSLQLGNFTMVCGFGEIPAQAQEA